jgi:hypothetical protein
VLGLTDVDQVWEICTQVWGGDFIREDVRLLVTDDLTRRFGRN